MEEEFEIEKMNFDEYNRQIYSEKSQKQNKRNFFGYSQAFDAQKKYKLEIDKFVSEYKNGLLKNEIDEDNFKCIKKRKL